MRRFLRLFEDSWDCKLHTHLFPDAIGEDAFALLCREGVLEPAGHAETYPCPGSGRSCPRVEIGPSRPELGGEELFHGLNRPGKPRSFIGDAKDYLLENEKALVGSNNGTPIFVELPASVVLEVTYTEPGLQGDRSTGGTKPATLETGKEIQVPLFLEAGTKVKVNTSSGEYLGRVND